MATTYTPLLRVAKPTTGELSGTWGDTVNDNVTTMFEQAISGKATVVVADADQTLTTANGTTDQARCMMVECTSSTMSTTRNVVCPTSTKLYIVNNMANKSIVFKTVAGTGITIAAATCNIVYCDGTNVVSAVAGLFATLGANTFNGAQIFSDQLVSRAMQKDCADVVVDLGNISNATVTFDYTGGSVQTFTSTGSTVTWAFSNWPPTGNLGILEVIATNAGAYTQALTGVIWTIPAGTTTTSLATFLAANGTRTALQTSGIDRFLFQTRDAGTTIYGSLLA